MNFIILLTLLCPFIGFFLSFFLGKIVGKLGASIITTTFIYITMIISIYIFYNIMIVKEVYYIDICDWVSSYFINIKWSLQIDALTATMLLVVNIVSFCTHLYSVEYMEGDPYKVRFMSYLSLFTFFMIILVTASNLFQLFVGWEGVGICSYLLINFWFHRLQANKAALMAVMTNKVGDLALLAGFCMLLYTFKSLDYGILFSLATDNLFELNELNITTLNNITDTTIQVILQETIEPYKKYIYLVCLMFIIGAVGKSAQLGLHIWLPEAMEGPTPVSSLIHAATMVTAGIFLIIRCSFLFEVVQPVLLWAVLIGSLTSFFASTVACFQDDIKKVIAYSTCSQLGYMFTACGYSAYSNSIFHLFNHAFFKALLFLTAGYIIHAIANEQDMRRLGGLGRILPLQYVLICVGSFALTGFPFLSGFYSKEKILELFYSRVSLTLSDATGNLQWIYISQLISTTAVIFTIIYSAKMLAYVFSSRPEFPRTHHYAILLTQSNSRELYDRRKGYALTHDATSILIIPLFLLSLLSIGSGYIFSDMMVGPANMFWNDALFVAGQETNVYNIYNVSEWTILNFEFNKYIKGVSIVMGLYYSFIFLFYFGEWTQFDWFILDNRDEYISEFMRRQDGWEDITIWQLNIKTIMNEKYIFINKIWIEPVSNYFLQIGITLYYILDRGIIELIGPLGIVKQLHTIIYKYEKYQTNKRTTIYLNIMIISILTLCFIILLYI